MSCLQRQSTLLKKMNLIDNVLITVCACDSVVGLDGLGYGKDFSKAKL